MVYDLNKKFIFVASFILIILLFLTSSCTWYSQKSYYGYSDVSNTIKGLWKVGISNYFGLNHTKFNLTIMFNTINSSVEPHNANFINHNLTFNITLKNEGPNPINNVSFLLDQGICYSKNNNDLLESQLSCEHSLGIPILLSSKCKELNFGQKWFLNFTPKDRHNFFFRILSYNPNSWILGNNLVLSSNTDNQTYDNNNFFFPYYNYFYILSYPYSSEFMNLIDNTISDIDFYQNITHVSLNITALSNNTFVCVNSYSLQHYTSLNTTHINKINPKQKINISVNSFINPSSVLSDIQYILSNFDFLSENNINQNLILKAQNNGFDNIPLNLSYNPSKIDLDYYVFNYSFSPLHNSLSWDFDTDDLYPFYYLYKDINSNKNLTILAYVSKKDNYTDFFSFKTSRFNPILNYSNVSINCTGDLCSAMSECYLNNTNSCNGSYIKQLSSNSSILKLSFNLSNFKLGYHFANLRLMGKNVPFKSSKDIVIYLYNFTNNAKLKNQSKYYGYGSKLDIKTISQFTNTSDSSFNPLSTDFDYKQRNQSLLLGDTVNFYFEMAPLNPSVLNILYSIPPHDLNTSFFANTSFFKNATFVLYLPNGTVLSRVINFTASNNSGFMVFSFKTSYHPTQLGKYYGYISTRDIYNNPYSKYFVFNVVKNYTIKSINYYIDYNNLLFYLYSFINFNKSFIAIGNSTSMIYSNYNGIYLSSYNVRISNSTPLLYFDNVSVYLKNNTGLYMISNPIVNESNKTVILNTFSILFNKSKLLNLKGGKYSLILDTEKNNISKNYTMPVSLFREPIIKYNFCRYYNKSDCYFNTTNPDQINIYSLSPFYFDPTNESNNKFNFSFSFKHLGKSLKQLNISYNVSCLKEVKQPNPPYLFPVNDFNSLKYYPHGKITINNIKQNETINFSLAVEANKNISALSMCFVNISVNDSDNYYPYYYSVIKKPLTYVFLLPLQFYPDKKLIPTISYSSYNFRPNKVFQLKFDLLYFGSLYFDYNSSNIADDVKLIVNKSDFYVISPDENKINICDESQMNQYAKDISGSCDKAVFALMPKRIGNLSYSLKYYDIVSHKYVTKTYSVYVNNKSFDYNSSISSDSVKVGKSVYINFSLKNIYNQSLTDCYFYINHNPLYLIKTSPYIFYYLLPNQTLNKKIIIQGIKPGSSTVNLNFKCDNNYFIKIYYPLSVVPSPITHHKVSGGGGGLIPFIETNNKKKYIYNLSYGKSKWLVIENNSNYYVIKNISKEIMEIILPNINNSNSVSIKIEELNISNNNNNSSESDYNINLQRNIKQKIKQFIISTKNKKNNLKNNVTSVLNKTLFNKLKMYYVNNGFNNFSISVLNYSFIKLIKLSTLIKNETLLKNKYITILFRLNISHLIGELNNSFNKLNKINSSIKNNNLILNQTYKYAIIVYSINKENSSISNIIDLNNLKCNNNECYIRLNSQLTNTTQYIVPIITKLAISKNHKVIPKITIINKSNNFTNHVKINKTLIKHNKNNPSYLLLIIFIILGIILLFLITITEFEKYKTNNNVTNKVLQKPNSQNKNNNVNNYKSSNYKDRKEIPNITNGEANHDKININNNNNYNSNNYSKTNNRSNIDVGNEENKTAQKNHNISSKATFKDINNNMNYSNNNLNNDVSISAKDIKNNIANLKDEHANNFVDAEIININKNKTKNDLNILDQSVPEQNIPEQNRSPNGTINSNLNNNSINDFDNSRVYRSSNDYIFNDEIIKNQNKINQNKLKSNKLNNINNVNHKNNNHDTNYETFSFNYSNKKMNVNNKTKKHMRDDKLYNNQQHEQKSRRSIKENNIDEDIKNALMQKEKGKY